MPAEPCKSVSTDTPVLKKLAPLTLSKAELESKVSKPKFVPEKLDFQLYEKFEGEFSDVLYDFESVRCSYVLSSVSDIG